MILPWILNQEMFKVHYLRRKHLSVKNPKEMRGSCCGRRHVCCFPAGQSKSHRWQSPESGRQGLSGVDAGVEWGENWGHGAISVPYSSFPLLGHIVAPAPVSCLVYGDGLPSVSPGCHLLVLRPRHHFLRALVLFLGCHLLSVGLSVLHCFPHCRLRALSLTHWKPFEEGTGSCSQQCPQVGGTH